MKRQIVIGPLLIAVMTVGIYSQAVAGTGNRMKSDRAGDCSPQEPGQGGERFLKKMAKELKLTDAQQGQIKAIFTAEREKSAPLMEKMAETRKQLHEAAGAEKFDEATVRSIAVKKAELEIELTVSRAKVRHSINALLTPEQRKKAEQLVPQGKPRRGMLSPPPDDQPLGRFQDQ